MIERLVYVSTASNRQDVTGQAAKIAEEARTYNRDNEISGALVGHEGHFIHALEGEPPVLDQLLKRLEDDPRHYDLVLVDRWTVDDLLFDGWTVAGVAMDTGTGADLEALIADPTLSPRPLVETMRSRAVPHA